MDSIKKCRTDALIQFDIMPFGNKRNFHVSIHAWTTQAKMKIVTLFSVIDYNYFIRISKILLTACENRCIYTIHGSFFCKVLFSNFHKSPTTVDSENLWAATNHNRQSCRGS